MKPFQQMSKPERDMVIRILLAEAGNQGPQGLEAVAAVIGNRASQSGMSPGQVVTAKNQFEPYNTAAGRARMAKYDPNSPAYQGAGQAIDRLASGAPDPTGGATHFYSPRTQAALGRPTPSWAQGQGRDIGDHRFYNLGYQPGGNRHGIPPRPPGDIQAPMAPQAPQAPRAPQIAQVTPRQGAFPVNDLSSQAMTPQPRPPVPTQAPSPFLPEASPTARPPFAHPQGGYSPASELFDPKPAPLEPVKEVPTSTAPDIVKEVAQELGLSRAEEENFKLGLQLGGSDPFGLFGGWGGGLQGGFSSGGFGAEGVG